MQGTHKNCVLTYSIAEDNWPSIFFLLHNAILAPRYQDVSFLLLHLQAAIDHWCCEVYHYGPQGEATDVLGHVFSPDRQEKTVSMLQNVWFGDGEVCLSSSTRILYQRLIPTVLLSHTHIELPQPNIV